MITHTFTRGWRSGSLAISKEVAIAAGAEINVDESIAAAAVDAPVIFALTAAQIRGLYITSNRALTVKTNNATTPGNTFTLAADAPFVWLFGDGTLRDSAGVAVVNITSLFAVNSDADNAAELQIRALFDPTV